jgi:hypothetical protein
VAGIIDRSPPRCFQVDHFASFNGARLALHFMSRGFVGHGGLPSLHVAMSRTPVGRDRTPHFMSRRTGNDSG